MCPIRKQLGAEHSSVEWPVLRIWDPMEVCTGMSYSTRRTRRMFIDKPTHDLHHDKLSCHGHALHALDFSWIDKLLEPHQKSSFPLSPQGAQSHASSICYGGVTVSIACEKANQGVSRAWGVSHYFRERSWLCRGPFQECSL